MENINLAAGKGQLKVLKYLADKGHLPGVDGANLAAMNGHFEVLSFLSCHGIHPTSIGADLAAMNGYFDVVVYIYIRLGIKVTYEGFKKAKEYGDEDLIRYIEMTYEA